MLLIPGSGPSDYNEAYEWLVQKVGKEKVYMLGHSLGVQVGIDLTELCGKATYAQIHDYVLEQTGLNVSRLYIAQIKKKCGFEVGENHNLPKSEDARQPKCPTEE